MRPDDESILDRQYVATGDPIFLPGMAALTEAGGWQASVAHHDLGGVPGASAPGVVADAGTSVG